MSSGAHYSETPTCFECPRMDQRPPGGGTARKRRRTSDGARGRALQRTFRDRRSWQRTFRELVLANWWVRAGGRSWQRTFRELVVDGRREILEAHFSRGG